MPWKKSTRSGANGCVEVALAPISVAVRDSMNPSGPIVRFTPDAWRAFIDDVRAGRYDRPAT
jgi:hypothetical protein